MTDIMPWEIPFGIIGDYLIPSPKRRVRKMLRFVCVAAAQSREMPRYARDAAHPSFGLTETDTQKIFDISESNIKATLLYGRKEIAGLPISQEAL